MLTGKITALACAGALTACIAASALAQDFVVDPAIATMSPEQLVETRQAIMKQNFSILKGAAGLSGEAAVAAASTLIQNYTDLPALFAEGSIVGDSKALPVIWEQKEAFDGIISQARGYAEEMKLAAESGDAATFGAGAKAIGGLCGQCHSKYRAR